MSVPALDTANIGTICSLLMPGCTAVTLADVLPRLAKIIHYDDDGSGGAEYVDGEMLIFTGAGNELDTSPECQMVRVRVRTDGVILAWIMKSTYVLYSGTGSYAHNTIIDLGADTTNQFDYLKQYNSTLMKITGTNDENTAMVGKYYYVNNCDATNNQISTSSVPFTTTHTYDIELYHTNAGLYWWGADQMALKGTTVLSRACYELWLLLRNNATVSNIPSTTVAPFIRPSPDSTLYITHYASQFTPVYKCFQYDLNLDTYTDYTTEANNGTANDVLPFPAVEAVGDTFYIGFKSPIDQLCYNVGTATASTPSVVWYFWRKSTQSWVSLTGSYLTEYGDYRWLEAGMSVISVNNYDDNLEPTTINGVTAYWIKGVLTSGSFTINPLITQIWGRPNEDYNGSYYQHYNYEYPSATNIFFGSYTSHVYQVTQYGYYTVLPQYTAYFIGANQNISSSHFNDTSFPNMGDRYSHYDLSFPPYAGSIAGEGHRFYFGRNDGYGGVVVIYG